jgi:hypothetical protein
VDNSNLPAASSTATFGVETPITLDQLKARLVKLGNTVKVLSKNKSGLFLPAKYYPVNIDGAFAQIYVFTSAEQAQGAAATVDSDGFVVGVTPTQLVNVNWTGWPAFFRSGDMIAVFVTEKGPNAHVARDKRVFSALKSIFGPPFIGGQTAPASLATGTPVPSGSHPSTSTPSSTTTGG